MVTTTNRADPEKGRAGGDPPERPTTDAWNQSRFRFPPRAEASLSERPADRLCFSNVSDEDRGWECPMASRPIHWHEGMFLRPQHFQVADRNARESLRDSEDWFHPFNWGVRTVEFDREAFGNYSAVLRSCEAAVQGWDQDLDPGRRHRRPCGAEERAGELRAR